MTQNAVDIERSIVGLAISDQNEILTVLDVLKPEHFYDEKYCAIWKSILNLKKSSVSVDIVTIIADLKKENFLEFCGGAYEISKLSDFSGYGHTAEFMSGIIIQKYLLRKIYVFADNVKAKTLLHDADCFDIAEQFGALISNVSSFISSNKIRPIIEYRDEILADCENVFKTGVVNGIPIRLKLLQECTNGWRKGNLIVIAARPGMGKTASAIEFAEHPASMGIPVAFFSLEMTAKELTGRIMSRYSNYSAQRINNNIVDSLDEIGYIKTLTDSFDSLPLYIDDSPYLTLHQLRIKSMRLKREKNIEIIFIDYLQLMTGDPKDGNREQQLSNISRGLKALAKELDVPVIALAQLNRDVAKRIGDQKPKPSDIRECGAIEQDADMIIFPHRPEEIPDQTEYMMEGRPMDISGLIVYIIAKFRGGKKGEIPATWVGRTMSVYDYEY